MILALVLALVVQLALPAWAAIVLRRRDRPWRRRWLALLTPAPIPAIIIALCAWRFLDAALASRRECGVDACAMAMAGAMAIAGVAVVVYAVAVLAVALVLRLMPTPTRNGVHTAGTFE